MSTGATPAPMRSTTQDVQLPLFDGASASALAEDVRDWARSSAEATPDRMRMAHARAFCTAAVQRYWQRLSSGKAGRLREPVGSARPLRRDALEAAVTLGDSAAASKVDDAAYLVGSTYATMLPREVRTKSGVYYTPPPLVTRLLDVAEQAGVDWSTAHVLDPACGGGAFLGPIASRMVESLQGCNRRVIVRNVVARLRGFEIDPFAAWMSRTFLAATLHTLLDGAANELDGAVTECNSLLRTEPEEFDLVIGNPPYGRVTLDAEQRAMFRRSLFGHANLYGVFLDLAIRKTKPRGGVIAYVTPTSFLSGEYFKRLRELLAREANPVSLELVAERTGVFDGVLQETALAVYRRGEASRSPCVSFVEATETRVHAIPGGKVLLADDMASPWVLPRSKREVALTQRMRSMTSRLEDWGYKVSTGPLVWNRYKDQLSSRPGRGSIPIVWAESVSADGTFSLRSARRNHLPYFRVEKADEWLRVRHGCVLLQRTTAKEQPRRLVAAELPQSLVDEHGSVTVENHLNMLVPIVPRPPVDTGVLAAFLNSSVADRAFRCISGSVAVSAYELQSLALPAPESMQPLERMLRKPSSRAHVDEICDAIYHGRVE
jgi:adenine-specific DNA-methyltransferase